MYTPTTRRQARLSISKTGEVLASEDFPNEQRKAVADWIAQERAELMREWETLIAGGEWFTINKPNK